MGKLVSIATFERFRSLWESDLVDDHSLNFILDTGQLYTHGVFINSAAFGTAANGAVSLTIAGTSNTLALSSHTHSNYYDNSHDIDIGNNKIISGNNDLLYCNQNALYLGNTSNPTYISGDGIYARRGLNSYTVLDTGNFEVTNTTNQGYTFSNTAIIKYGSSSFLIDYVKRLNTSQAFDYLHGYTLAGTNRLNGVLYGYISFVDDPTAFDPDWALLRINIPNKTVQFRTSADANNWVDITVPTINLNALNVAGIVAAPTLLTINKVWKTDDLGNPAWRDEVSYTFSNLLFLLIENTNLMTYNSQATKTILAGDNIAFSYEDNVLTIRAQDTTYNNFTAATATTAGNAGLVPGPGTNKLGTDGYFLRADGSWEVPTDTWKAVSTSQEGYVPRLQTGGGTITSTDVAYVLAYKSGVNNTTLPVWIQLPTNAYENTWTAWVPATSSTNGTAGIYPAPGINNRDKFLRGDGTWCSLNNYSLPTASSSTLGGVKTGEAVTDTSGMTAVHIKDGVIYYKDTNTTYSTATSSALGLVKVGDAISDATGYTACKIKDGVIYYKDTNTTYSFSNLLFLLNSGTNLMTYNSQAVRTVLAGSNITFTHSNNVLTITAKDTTYSTVSKTAAGLCPILPNETTTTKYLRLDGTWVKPPNDNTWNANAVGVAGYVAAPTKAANANMTWQTDADGNPAWRASNNHTHSYLPLSGANYNTSTDTNPFTISRTGGTSEAMLIMLNDSRTLFKYTNDEAASSIVFLLVNTDTERASNNGADASDRNVTISSSSTGISLSVGGTLVSLNGHTHSYLPCYNDSSLNADNATEGWHNVRASITNGANTNHSTLIYVSNIGTPYQLQIPDSSVLYIYKRWYSSSTWSAWSKISAGYADSAGGISGYTFKTLSSKSHTGWNNNTTDDKIIPTMSFMAYWNGAYSSGNSSNLTYCVKGAFGSIVTKNTDDYLPIIGGTMTGHITMAGLAIYFGKSGSNAVMSYSSDYPKYGIWYNDTTVDQMMFSASNNADDASKADFAINGGGDGVLTSRGNVILHASNYSSYALPLSGGTMRGDIGMKTSTNDTPDIIWYYSNGQEKARIWYPDTPTSATGPYYRIYKSDGTSLYSGTLAMVGQLNNYLPLSGGTLTGNLTMNGGDIYIMGGNSGTRKFGFKRTNTNRNIDVGWDWNNRDGSGAFFQSVDDGTPGSFGFFARDASATAQLRGKPDGTLLWQKVANGTWYDILRADNYSSYALPLSGGTITGDLSFKAAATIPPNIIWYYKSGQELARIYFSEKLGAHKGPSYRKYKSDGSEEYVGYLMTMDGGIISGQIQGTGTMGGSWNLGSIHACLYLTSSTYNNWHPVIGFKTPSGNWTFGSVGVDELADFVYFATSNTTNTPSAKVRLRTTDGTIALTSDLSSYLPLSGGTLTGALGINSVDQCALTAIHKHLYGSTENGSVQLVGGFYGLWNSSWTAVNGIGLGARVLIGVLSTKCGIIEWVGDSNWANSGKFSFINKTNGTEYKALTISSNGNVGINTTSPSQKLHVSGGQILVNPTAGTWATALDSYCSSLGAGQAVTITLGKTNSNNNACSLQYHHVGDGNSNNYLALSMFGANRLLTVNAAGNVGIGLGTTSPSYKLHVSGAGYFTGTLFSTSSSTANIGVHVQSTSTANSGHNEACVQFSTANSSGTMTSRGFVGWLWKRGTYIYNSNAKVWLSIYDNGNAGIGTGDTAPSYKFQVVGDIGCYNVIPISHDTYHLGTEANSWLYIYTKAIRFGSNTSDNWSDGKWSHPHYGININSVASADSEDVKSYSFAISHYWGMTLHTASGTFRIKLGGAIVHNNSITCTSLSLSSDLRLKNILYNTNLELKDIATAPIFTFTWNNINDSKLHIGTSAQYWKLILPEAVYSLDDKIQTLSLDYSVLGVVASISIAREVIKLRNLVSDLTSEVNRLKLLLEE